MVMTVVATAGGVLGAVLDGMTLGGGGDDVAGGGDVVAWRASRVAGRARALVLRALSRKMEADVEKWMFGSG